MTASSLRVLSLLYYLALRHLLIFQILLIPINHEPFAINTTEIAVTVADKDKDNNQPDLQEEFREIRSLKRIKDNLLLANVEISSNSLKITPSEGIKLNLNTPPFRSFFLNRILEGYENKRRGKSKSRSN